MAAEQKTISLRGSTRGELTEFLERENKDCAYSNKVISGFLGKLWNYKEEGVELNPVIIYADNIDEFGRKLPGFTQITVGNCASDEEAAKKILKDCAPLTGESNLIFAEREADGRTLKYGIFSFLRTPTALGIEEALKLDAAQFAVLIKKSSPTTLQVIGSGENSVSVLMSTLREKDESTGELNKFIADITATAADGAEAYQKYLSKTLARELSVCHGTILICSNCDQHPRVDEIGDHIPLNPPISFLRLFIEYQKENGAEQLLELQRAEELLRGFLSCDGMIVFSTNGDILSYRVFYKPIGEADKTVDIVGGARRRAFAGISRIRSEHMRSALFRSQDGSTEYTEILNEQ